MHKLTGFILVIVSAAAYGVMPILARFAYAAGADPLSVLFLRFSIAAAIMAVIMVLAGMPLPRGQTLLGLFLLGATCYVGQAVCYFTALTLADASLVALLLYLYPVTVTAFAAVFLGEKLTWLKGAALGLAMMGAVLVVGLGGEGKPLGIVLGIAAPLIYSATIVIGARLLQSAPAIPASTVIMIAADLSFGGIVAVRGARWPATPGGWLACLGLAVIAGVVAIGAFLMGLARVGPTYAALLSTLEPVVAVSLAALLLGERLTPLNLLGGAMILGAVILLTRSEEHPAASAAPDEVGGES